MKLTSEKIILSNAAVLIFWLIIHEEAIKVLSDYVHLPTSYSKSIIDTLLIIGSSVALFYAIRKQRKTHLRYENEYRSIFQTSPFPLWIYDRETLKFLEVNKAAEDHYGYTRQEFLKMTILDIREEDIHEQTRLAAAQMPETYKSSGYWEHVRKNGEIITVYITSRKIRFRERKCVMVIAQDVTIQVMQEQKLNELYIAEQEHKELLEQHILRLKDTLEEKERLAQVIDRINNIVIITDSSARITWVNKAFTNFTGYQPEEVQGKTVDLLHGPKTDPATQDQIMHSLQNREFRSFEILNYTKDGEEYWVDMTFSPIYDERGEIVRYISIQNVITEKKAINDKIREQNQVLKNIAWTNSHAVRKPVASILSLVRISSEMELPTELREVHDLIGLCAEELDAITKEVAEKIKDE